VGSVGANATIAIMGRNMAKMSVQACTEPAALCCMVIGVFKTAVAFMASDIFNREWWAL